MNYFEKARPAIQTEHFVCGSYQKAVSENYFTALNPADQKPVAAFALGEAVDMKTAIDHARRAFDKGRWPKMSPKERGEILQNFARLIKKKAKFLGIVESLTVGKLLDDCINHDVARAAENIEFFAKEMELGEK